MTTIEKAVEKLKTAGQVAVLTGAGISSESGIPTFRGSGGLWKNFRAEELATPQAFAQDPRLVWEWYEWRREICRKADPNPGHSTVASMEKYFERFLLITQNVDGLHRRAGSEKIVEIHGNIWKARCLECPEIFDIFEAQSELPVKCPSCASLARPHIVWFGESYDPEILNKSQEFLIHSDVVLVIGSSGAVTIPVRLASIAKSSGAFTIEINPLESYFTREADLFIQEKAGVALPDLWRRVAT